MQDGVSGAQTAVFCLSCLPATLPIATSVAAGLKTALSNRETGDSQPHHTRANFNAVMLTSQIKSTNSTLHFNIGTL